MILRRLLQFPLRIWHGFISPFLPPMCRFHPSCSVYAIEALEHFPLHRALWLIIKRLVKCQPLHPGGFDPLPDPEGGHHTGGGEASRSIPMSSSRDRFHGIR